MHIEALGPEDVKDAIFRPDTLVLVDDIAFLKPDGPAVRTRHSSSDSRKWRNFPDTMAATKA
jgi:hypothetical protein